MSRIKLRFHSYCGIEEVLEDGRLKVSYELTGLVPATMEGIVAFERSWPHNKKAKQMLKQRASSGYYSFTACGKLSFYRSETDEWYKIDEEWIKSTLIDGDEYMHIGLSPYIMPPQFQPKANTKKNKSQSIRLSDYPKQYNMRAYHTKFEPGESYILKKYKRPVLTTMVQTVRVDGEMIAKALDDAYSI